jgi:hypothetical protein
MVVKLPDWKEVSVSEKREGKIFAKLRFHFLYFTLPNVLFIPKDSFTLLQSQRNGGSGNGTDWSVGRLVSSGRR